MSEDFNIHVRVPEGERFPTLPTLARASRPEWLEHNAVTCFVCERRVPPRRAWFRCLVEVKGGFAALAFCPDCRAACADGVLKKNVDVRLTNG